MLKCEMCNSRKDSVKIQRGRKNQIIFRMCTRCGEAVARQAARFKREEKLKLEAARNV